MRIVILSLLAGLLLTSCTLAAGGDPPPKADRDHLISFAGTVTYIPLEGGFFGLVAEDGSRYDPLQLPEAFRHDGLAVQVTARRLEGMVGFHMWGQKIEIVDILRR
ncbi:MAG: hypothetical protein IH614_02700 [Desulfuromonadales bacterium]|nr:hypothetical protein [Desulfuromonadales bacterium]